MNMVLRAPAADEEAALRRLHEQLLGEGFSFLLAEGSWSDILSTIEREAAGINLPADRVRADFLIAEAAGEVVGRVSIRYELNDFLLNEGGHIGYAVAPDHRGRGYAKEIVRQSLERLSGAGIRHALLTCDDTNAASIAVIEHCGGVLEDVRMSHDGDPIRRYWIDAP